MLYSLKGELIHLEPRVAVICCGGVGFRCQITMNTARQLPPVGKEAMLYTMMNVREDAIELFGFAEQKELSCLPQAIAVIWLDNNEDMVLITRVKGSEGRRLLPYEGPVSALPVQARQRILADVDRLLEENSAISAVAEGKDWWNVIEGEGSIIFSRCEIAFVPDAAKAAYRSRVLKMLELDE